MTRIEVELAAVERLARRLSATGEVLTGAGRALAAGEHGAGSPELAGAIAELGRAWRHGLSVTGGAAVDAGTQLQAAVDEYREVEAAIAAACR